MMENRILIVEDDTAVRNLMYEFLTRSGYEAITANSAEEAEKVLEEEEIHIIVTDVRLPGTDGITFTKNVKKLYDLDVIITTGYSSEYFYEDAINNGAIFIDIDNFKGINDTYGHMIGDQALLLIAQKMQTSLRAQDTAYRFAGDEFTIILPETTSENAKFVADRIKAEMEKENLVIHDKEIAKITLSMGIAEYQRNEKKEQFVHRADVTMYEAKKRGGNHIAVSPRLAVVSNKSLVEPAGGNI
jgi:diguanylate cyclase (GGDEF)-like protein